MSFRKDPGIHLAGVGFVLLVISIAVSNSGMEIGKGMILFGGLLTGFLAWVRKEPFNLRGFLSPGFLCLGAWILSWALSVVFTEELGNARAGTLRVLPVQAALLLFIVALGAWKRPWPWRFVVPFFVIACGVCFVYSLSTHGDGRSHGFLGNPVSYSHVLGVMLTGLSCLGVWIWRQRPPWSPGLRGGRIHRIFPALVVGGVLAIGLRDLAVNESRSLVLPLVLVPLLLFMEATAGKKRTWLALPALFLALVLLTPSNLVEKILFRIRISTVQESVWVPRTVERSGHGLIFQGPLGVGADQVSFIQVDAYPQPHIASGHLEKSGGMGTLRLEMPRRFMTDPLTFKVLFAAGGGAVQETWLGILPGQGVQEARLIATRCYTPVGVSLPDCMVAIRRHGLQKLSLDFLDYDRLWVWRSSWEMIKRHPFLGVGPGNWRWASLLPEVNPGAPYFAAEIAPGGNYFHAHNNLLNLASECGIPAAVFYLALVFWLLAKGLVTPLAIAPRLRRLCAKAGSSASRGRCLRLRSAAFLHFSLALILLTVNLSGIFDYTVFSIAGHVSALCLGLLLAKEAGGLRIRLQGA